LIEQCSNSRKDRLIFAQLAIGVIADVIHCMPSVWRGIDFSQINTQHGNI
jgi:hypothetical protein